MSKNSTLALRLHGYLKLVASKVKTIQLHEQVMSLRQSVSALRQRLLWTNGADRGQAGSLPAGVVHRCPRHLHHHQEQDDSGSLKAADLPDTLRKRFIA